MSKKNLNNLNFQFTDLKPFILNCINDLKGQDIICFDVEKYNLTKLAILCSGYSKHHVISIAHNILHALYNIRFSYYGIEGLKSGQWILIDLGNIIIHIMNKETRQLYALEKLWS